MMGLIDFLEEHGESIEADLQRYYNVRLSDVFTGKLSWRRLHVLVSQLPYDSQTSLSVNGGEILWKHNEELLAAIVDILAVANWQRGGGKGQRPKPVKRPHDEKKAKITPEEVKAQAQAKVQERKDVMSQQEFDRVMFGI